MQLHNDTPFAVGHTVMPDGLGRELLLIVVKGTYHLLQQGAHAALERAEEQQPLQLADTHYGQAESSSILYESDFSPAKAAVDVVLVGHAYAPRGGAPELDVSVSVGSHSSTVRVFGERAWLGSGAMSKPRRFEHMPLVYERGFGGIDQSARDAQNHEREARNPVGRGFRARQSELSLEGALLPNLEDPLALIERPTDRPEPVGFGFVGRSWQPRCTYAGTYDEVWEKTRSPRPPEDFDNRYFNGAHPRLQVPFLMGGEAVAVSNASRGRQLQFELPLALPSVTIYARKRHYVELQLDTVVIEPDQERLSLVWRGSRVVKKDLYVIEHIHVEAPGA